MGFDRDAFAANLRGLRARADLTQAQLAERAGVSAASVFQYEDGSAVPGMDKAFRLAEALGVTVDELTGFARG